MQNKIKRLLTLTEIKKQLTFKKHFRPERFRNVSILSLCRVNFVLQQVGIFKT
ncbi:hypothetical protein ADIARSV_0157 [Arcticibacter svalbardensis MN12-7]|uniref:Uncharacterized protein n=1 Tax=Arcticibacter svalbardensis MN12-7 TaxID=1150600 RepID=R9H6F5_9SPHI|nr:hypothetical protein ADIARSV_0157 [Arcticibacter svalbardensis MN12-7]